MAMGRPARPYVAKDGTIVPGLYHCPDGRWRINRTGAKFTCHDERLAIKKFRELTEIKPETTTLLGETEFSHIQAVGEGPIPTGKIIVESQQLWDFFREALLQRPIHVAAMTGIPELANFAQMQIPGKPLECQAVWKYYETENQSGDKRATKRIWDRMIHQTGATTLADLSLESLHGFKMSIENDKDINSGGTKVWMFGKIKAVLAFTKKSHDLDQVQISNALARCSVLWTSTPIPENNPKPIDKVHLLKLLVTAGDGPWRAWILLGLNAAMYIEELSSLEWDHINLDAGTLSMRRAKTSFPKVATLWPETVQALQSLRKGPKYVFTSPWGTRFQSSQSRCNEFAKLRGKTDVPSEVSFAQLRDGAYTAACRANIGDGRLAKILAGHSSGMEDKYVLRNPEIVKPACDAVYAHYGPFPV